jgi:ribosomal protein S18 acetylase RimI-like enzyme
LLKTAGQTRLAVCGGVSLRHFKTSPSDSQTLLTCTIGKTCGSVAGDGVVGIGTDSNATQPKKLPKPMQSVAIRRCVPGDESALSLVGQASFLEAFAGILPGSDIIAHCLRQHSVERYRAWLADGVSVVWIAECDSGNAPVGYLVLTAPDLPLADRGKGDIEIKRIYLLHRFHGLGLGGRLMQAAHSHAFQNGYSRTLLGVYGRNSGAISFYEHLGYRRVGERQFKVGKNTYDDLILGFRPE